MGKRILFSAQQVVGLACLVGVLTAFFIARALSQPPAPPNTQIGRYQIVSAGAAMAPYVYFLDTKTGQCWLADSPADSLNRKAWRAVPVPVSARGR